MTITQSSTDPDVALARRAADQLLANGTCLPSFAVMS